MLDEEVDVNLVQTVLAAYAPDLTDVDLEKMGNDPFLMAHALRGAGRIVVTTETSKRSLTRANRKIPDVCADLGIECVNTFGFTQRLDFRTNWMDDR